jgi:hypothetical protein
LASEFIPGPEHKAAAIALGETIFLRIAREHPSEPIAVCVVALLDAAVRLIRSAHVHATGQELPAAAACHELGIVVAAMRRGEEEG